jgi:hypothetical protein
MKCTIFNDNGSNNPGTILASATTITNPVTGLNTFTFASPPSVVAGTQYWVAFCSDTTSGQWFYYQGPQAIGMQWFSASYNNPTYASFPVANPTPMTVSNAFHACLMNVTPSILANATFVAETVEDSGQTYVSSSTVGQTDAYGLTPLSVTPSLVLAVVTRAYAQKTDAGTRVVNAQLTSGGITVNAPLALGISWGWFWRVDALDPNTGSGWNASAVNSASIGLQLAA